MLGFNAPRARQATISGDRRITRFVASTCAIAAARLAAAGVRRSLRAYIAHACAHFYCLGERPFPAHRHASGSVSSRAPPEPGRARLNASWRRNVGSTAWRWCWMEDRPASFFPRRASAGAGCCSPRIVIAGRREWPSAGGEFAGASGARGLAHIADDRLPAFVHRHVLHRDLLLAASAVALERLQLAGEGPRAFVERAREAISLGRAVADLLASRRANLMVAK